jgi:hypothetical protein
MPRTSIGQGINPSSARRVARDPERAKPIEIDLLVTLIRSLLARP